MKKVVLFLLLCFCAFSTIGLADIDDSSLGALLSGDWQTLVPEDLQATRNQLLQLLTPVSPTVAPKHALSTHRHYLLASSDLTS